MPSIMQSENDIIIIHDDKEMPSIMQSKNEIIIIQDDIEMLSDDDLCIIEDGKEMPSIMQSKNEIIIIEDDDSEPGTSSSARDRELNSSNVDNNSIDGSCLQASKMFNERFRPNASPKITQKITRSKLNNKERLKLVCINCNFIVSEEEEFLDHCNNQHRHESICFEKRYTNRKNEPSHPGAYLKLNGEQGEFKCTLCSYIADSLFALNVHLTDRHSKKKTTFCSACGYCSDILNEANDYITLKHVLYACPTCDYRCIDIPRLKLHVEMVHRFKFIFSCSNCPYYKCIDADEWHEHVKTVHEEKNSCTSLLCRVVKSSENELTCCHCEFTARNSLDLTWHVKRLHDGLGVFCCYYCNFTASENDEMEDHIQKLHHTRKRLVCQLCSDESWSSEALFKHMTARHGFKFQMKCPFCNFSYKVICLLASHLDNEHLESRTNRKSIEEESGFSCPLCHVTFITGNNLKKHVTDCHVSEKYCCTYCVFFTNRQLSLINHVTVVHKQGINACPDSEWPFNVSDANALSHSVHNEDDDDDVVDVHSKCKPNHRAYRRFKKLEYRCILCNLYCDNTVDFVQHIHTAHYCVLVSDPEVPHNAGEKYCPWCVFVTTDDIFTLHNHMLDNHKVFSVSP